MNQHHVEDDEWQSDGGFPDLKPASPQEYSEEEYDTEEEEERFYNRRGFVPTWDNTEELIGRIYEQIVTSNMDTIKLDEKVKEELEQVTDLFRRYKIMPREAYARLSEVMCALLGI
uniref:Uncharacterized protein n=1 Tax=Anopheles farauti TaxID=69004 RepID=A0A182QWP2_9DIPT